MTTNVPEVYTKDVETAVNEERPLTKRKSIACRLTLIKGLRRLIRT